MPYTSLDPLAQSFIIEKSCVVTKLDLFFSSKDSSLPVKLQIVKNSEGTPSGDIVPLSETIVHAANVITSSNANVATSIEFLNPIFLDAGEYSFTLSTDSDQYELWVSELGQTDITSSTKITEQPYVGAVFKAQNAGLYSPVEAEDIKFVLYRANYSTGTRATIDFNVGLDNYSQAHITKLETNPLELFPSSSTMRIYHKNHGMSDGSYVRIRNVANAFSNANVFSNIYGINTAAYEDVSLSISDVTTNTYTVTLPNASTVTTPTRFGGISVLAEQDVRFETIYPKISSIDQDGTIEAYFKATSTDYTADSSFTKLVLNSDNELDTPKVIASDPNVENNMSGANTFTFRVEMVANSSIIAPVLDTTQIGAVFIKNLVDNQTYDLVTLPEDEITVTQTSTTSNVTQVTGRYGLITLANVNDQGNARAIAKGTLLTISGSNPNAGTYRVINVLDEGANVEVYNLSANVITDYETANTYTIINGNKFIAEEAATGGIASSKYITREVNFINPSTSINLRMDVSKPADSTFEFYYKTKLVGETELISEKEFTSFGTVAIPDSLSGEFTEISMQADNLDPFVGVIIKVVFKTTNTAKVPKIKNFRLIALE